MQIPSHSSGVEHGTLTSSLLRNGFFSGLPGRKFLFALLAGTLISLGCVWAMVRYKQLEVAAGLELVAEERLALYTGTLHSALNKYCYLPYILASNPEVQRLLIHGDNRAVVNDYLRGINTTSGSMDLFILDRDGNALATSNWNDPGSFGGHSYQYRPYYRTAMLTGLGKYFGVGATTGRPGFFFTQAVRRAGPEAQAAQVVAERTKVDGFDPNILGVAVTKVDLSILQQEWQAGGETVIITDENGVIFLSSRDDWRYRSTHDLTPQVQTEILSQRQYGNTLPPPLNMQLSHKDGVDRLTIDGQVWLYATRSIDAYGWTLWFLRPESAFTKLTESLWLMGLGVVSVLIMLVLFIRVCYVEATGRREAREAQRIRTINQRLAGEVQMRKQTEMELLAAQDELLHAGQLAALGQVAASVAHELSQPVTSMRMFTSSCLRMAQAGQLEQVATTTGHMMELVYRLETLINQLKHLARKSSRRPEWVPVRQVLENALKVLHFKREDVGCRLEMHCPPHIEVFADALQLEQVCINLIHNAMDALNASKVAESPTPHAPAGESCGACVTCGRGSQGAQERAQAGNTLPKHPVDRYLRIFVEESPIDCLLSIEDNGSGIDAHVRERIFTPFFTTKKSGEGIGLGLSIVDKIVRSLQGEITVHNVLPHGTRFTIRLPRATKRKTL